MEYQIFGLKKSEYKYANVEAKADMIQAMCLNDAIDKFKNKYPDYIVFGAQGDLNDVWFNKNAEKEYKEKYGDKMNLDGR